MKKFQPYQWLAAIALLVTFLFSCKDEDPIPEVISGFTFTVDATDFKKVSFTNASTNFSKLSWDFGDGSAASSETNPVHTYAALGTYTVLLTATCTDGVSTVVSQQTVAITDPNAELTKLVGDVSKTWKLLRVANANTWPLEVGPILKNEVWWAMGRNNDELALRPCILNDEYTFGRDGSYKYNSNGDFWAEGGVFEPANLCQTTDPANLKGPNGLDLSAFGDGTHAFTLNLGAKPTLTVTGLGAFIGLPKIGTDREVSEPQASVTYDIIKVTDDAVDTLILEVGWKFPPYTGASDDAYWKMVLVHYDDPSQEPPIPNPAPIAGYTSSANGLTVSFTNTTKYGLSYSWDFGDGNTSTAKDPTHTYADGGAYKVTLTATNNAGNSTSTQELFVNAVALTEADLQGGAWKVRPEGNSVFVGPALGSNAWYIVPGNFLDGSSSGADDWSCMTNDEFTFGPGGVYTYDTKGDARNDGYMSTMPGQANGCISDAQLALSGNGAAFGSGTHSYTFTPASGSDRPIITLSNGATGAAFLGFYKGYYGGENSNNANPPNGGSATNRYEVMGYAKSATKEYLFVTVDISANKDGSASWSVVLIR